jgi:hypothetical protein
MRINALEFSCGLFSGVYAEDEGPGWMDSAIDMIWRAKGDGLDSLVILLPPRVEAVKHGVGDFPANPGPAGTNQGLVLDGGSSPAEVLIDGGGKMVALDVESRGSVITVGSGITLTLRNIVFKGHLGNDAPLVYVKEGGRLVFEEGAVVRDNANGGSRFAGGGALVGGTFIMKGGEVSGNAAAGGGGIYIEEGTYTGGGSLVMNGGTIRGNHAESGGGGVYVGKNASFVMSGGVISGNRAGGDGGGVVANGGRFEMSGGIIRGNVSASYGGGVVVADNGVFTKANAGNPDNSGVIYGLGERANSNIAGNGNGYAVYTFRDGKRRDATAGERDALYYNAAPDPDRGWEAGW